MINLRYFVKMYLQNKKTLIKKNANKVPLRLIPTLKIIKNLVFLKKKNKFCENFSKKNSKTKNAQKVSLCQIPNKKQKKGKF